MKRYKKSFKTKKKTSYWKTFKKTVGNRFFWFGLLFLGIISGISYLLFFSGVFDIKTIEVAGAEKVPIGEITRIVNQKINKNIILADTKRIAEEIALAYIEIAEIKIKRKLPNTILVQIEERKPVLVLKKDKLNLSIKEEFSEFSFLENRQVDEYYLIDKEGMVFEKSLSVPENIPEIKKEGQEVKLGETIVQKEEIEKILKIKDEITKLKIPVKEIIISSSKKVVIGTEQEWKIYLNLEKELDWQIEQLRIILEEKIPEQFREKLNYIDLRFNKIYISPELEYPGKE